MKFSLHLFIPLLIATILLVTLLRKKRRSSRWSYISSLIGLAIYIVILAGAIVADWHADYQLQQFDLNGDGFFTGDEITEKQRKALLNTSNDLGRNLSPVVGLFFATIITLFIYTIGRLTQYLFSK